MHIPHPSNEFQKASVWWLFVGIGLVAYGLGFTGLLWAKPEESLLTIAYETLQMFALHAPHVHHDVTTWPLHAGRLLAPMVTFAALVRIFPAIIRRDLLTATLLWRKNHVVVCGLGIHGLPLALQARKAGLMPVAIEKDPDSPGVREAIKAGIPVVIGDATRSETLHGARVHHAKEIFAVCTEDAVNVGIAATALSPDFKPPVPPNLRCRIIISDPLLRDNLRINSNAQGAGDRLDAKGFDMAAHRARCVFRDHPLDHLPLPEPMPGEKGRTATLVIVGFGELGHALAKQAARIGHFASGRKLILHIIDENASNLLAALTARIPKFRDICEVTCENGSWEDSSIQQKVLGMVKEADRKGEPMSVALAYDKSDSRNLSGALDLANSLEPALPLQILCYCSSDCGFTNLAPANGKRMLDGRVHLFGMLEKVWTLENLFSAKEDRIAEHLHQEYLAIMARQREAGELTGPLKPAELPWESLPERFRIASRAQADHLPVKIRALGLHIAPIKGNKEHRIDAFRGKNEMLSKLEHERWCANLWLDGWTYGGRDDARKVHNLLKPWDELQAHERNIDTEMIAAASRVLEKCIEVEKEGLGIFR